MSLLTATTGVAGGVSIAGWGTAVPARRVTNHDLEARLDTSDQWILERTGIRERRWAAPGESTGPLAVAAARQALDRAGLTPSEVGAVVVATSTPDRPMPSTAAGVAAALGITGGAFDVNAACAGFVYGLTTAYALVETGVTRTALLVGADVMTSIVDPEDRSTAVLFGDGAGALVLTGSRGIEPGAPGLVAPGLVATDLVGDPGGLDLLTIPAGGSALPASADTVAARQHFLKMDGREVFRRAVRGVTASVERTLARAGVTVDDVALFVPHQANARIVDAVLARTGLPAARTCGSVDRFGNTSAASIPIALAEAAQTGTVARGDLVLLCGFGAGFTIGTALWRWGTPTPPKKEAA
ncbi:MAG TPA: beta-ketoacyl-ACP synthase III [Acidimicrobiales bacterium]|nr:beta-ketoacyl-ACP synthase III [Acidimicrobiales bacterium]